MEDFNCPKCKSLFHDIPDIWNGQRIKCSLCGFSFVAGEQMFDEKERIIHHSFICMFLILLLFMGLQLIIWAYAKEIEMNAFFWTALIIACIILSYRHCYSNPIRLSPYGICTRNPVWPGIISVSWNEIQDIKTWNMGLIKILVIRIKTENGDSQKVWFGYFSLSTKKLFDEMEFSSSGLVKHGNVDQDMIQSLGLAAVTNRSDHFREMAHSVRMQFRFSRNAIGFMALVFFVFGLIAFLYQMRTGFENFALKSEPVAYIAIDAIMAILLFSINTHQKQIKLFFRCLVAIIVIGGIHKLPFWGYGMKWVLFLVSSAAHYLTIFILAYIYFKWECVEGEKT